jgi:hypothetical protein
MNPRDLDRRPSRWVEDGGAGSVSQRLLGAARTLVMGPTCLMRWVLMRCKGYRWGEYQCVLWGGIEEFSGPSFVAPMRRMVRCCSKEMGGVVVLVGW